MAQDWREQLQSEDPKIRAEGIRQIALSGNRDNLHFLKEIAENDPDPRLQEYAKKAAQHLFSSSWKDELNKQPSAASPPDRQAVPEKAQDLPPEDIPKPAVSSKNRETANAKVQRALTLHMYGKTQKAIKTFIQALDLDPSLEEDTYTRNVAAELTGQPSNLAIKTLKEPSFADAGSPSSQGRDTPIEKETEPRMDVDDAESSSPRGNLMQAWLSFFGMNEEFFQAEARKANSEDTLVSVLVFTIASVVIFMINGFFQFQRINTIMEEGLPGMETDLPPMDFNIGIIFFAILIGTVIITPLSFYLTVGLHYLGGRLFGGSGTFKTHAYLMALVQVPMTIISSVISLLALVPLVNFLAGLAGFGLSIYSIILIVRLVKVTHKLETGRAVAAIFVPSIVLIMIGSCLFFTIGSTLLGSLMQLQ